MSGHVCGSECWYIAKRRGRKVRGRNRCTGAWERHWWPAEFYESIIGRRETGGEA